jgi:Raf kinase inhibitor-like YbhB/YbcL family protein
MRFSRCGLTLCRRTLVLWRSSLSLWRRTLVLPCVVLGFAYGGWIATAAQTPPAGGVQPPPPPPAGQRGAQPAPLGGRGRGRGPIPVMTLSSGAFADGAKIPAKYTQAGEEASPALTWSGAPEGVESFVLIVHDVDTAIGPGNDDMLHWMLWNIPATATSLAEHVPLAPQLPDGTRQISATGPSYRGPGAPASGPPHHYAFELFALDTMLDTPAVGASPPQTRAAILSAMAGHVRAKAALVGLFKRE